VIVNGSDALELFLLRKRVLLINPPILDYLTHTIPDAAGAWSQPTGLLRIAAKLRGPCRKLAMIDCLSDWDSGTLAARYVDSVFQNGQSEDRYWIGQSEEWLEEQLDQIGFEPDLVLLTTTMTYWWRAASRVASVVKQRFPKAMLAAGGVYPSLAPIHAEKHLGADVIVRGKIPEVLGGATNVSLLEKTPSYAIVETSSGCPWNCAYCAQRTINGKGIRLRSGARVLREIQEKHNLGVKRFVLFADNILAPKGHFEKILQGIVDSRLDIVLEAPKGLEPDLLDASLLGLMKAAGWRTLRLALESDNQNLRSSWNREHSQPGQFLRSVELCLESGFAAQDIHIFLLYGTPGENIDEVEATARRISRLGVMIAPMPLTPVPGSALFERFRGFLFSSYGESLERLHERLYPFAPLNGVAAADYRSLEKLMRELNGSVARANGVANLVSAPNLTVADNSLSARKEQVA